MNLTILKVGYPEQRECSRVKKIVQQECPVLPCHTCFSRGMIFPSRLILGFQLNQPNSRQYRFAFDFTIVVTDSESPFIWSYYNPLLYSFNPLLYSYLSEPCSPFTSLRFFSYINPFLEKMFFTPLTVLLFLYPAKPWP